jgi:hypothetical protein
VRDELQRARDALSRGSEGAGPFGTALEEAALRLSREAWRKE